MIVFPNAIEARAGSRNNLAIYDEIRFIERSILEVISQGQLKVQINTSPMTSIGTGESYYLVHIGDLNDRSLAEQMLMVEKHFKNMGYQIVRKANLATKTTFFWEVLW